MPVYKRRRKVNPNDTNVHVDFVDETGDSFEEYIVYHPKFLTWMKVNNIDTEKRYTQQEIDALVQQSPYYKATANDVDWREKVRMQGSIQKWVDHSISVTINLPNDVSEDLVNELYVEAWRSGCKGCTVYRDGSRSGVLISLAGDGKNKKKGDGGGWRKYVPFVKAKKEEKPAPPELFIVPEKFNRKKPIYISEDNYRQYKFATCCHPIPGDDALGYIDNRNQIEIHKRSCPVAAKLKTSYGNRILDAKWDMHKRLFFDATIHISGIDRIGLLNEVTQVISSQMNVNIHKVTITCEDDIFEGTLELRVHDRDDVRAIIDGLKSVQDLKEISQIQ